MHTQLQIACTSPNYFMYIIIYIVFLNILFVSRLVEHTNTVKHNN